ncbi:hypothetical protein [Flavobacterium sp. 3HN19-14]|uniref:hypothetical protein n=1 Tax=Flavobacterium sp. 3HN19-14 TaxID=3448133 RepID=UPI003EE09AE2
MQHDIDTLFYEARGGSGGAEFVTPRIDLQSIKLYKSADFYRLDSLAVVDKDNNYRIGGNHSEPEYDHFNLADQKGKHLKIFYRNDDDPDKKMQKNERVYAGAYGVSFFTPGVNEGKGTQIFEDGYHYCRGVAKNWGLTNYYIPDNFEFSGFHGRYGGRIDKLGIIIERKY